MFEIDTDAAAPTSGTVCALAAHSCALVSLRVRPAVDMLRLLSSGVQLAFFSPNEKKKSPTLLMGPLII
jgi:hypothetical protein